MKNNKIIIKGANENNLKNVSLEIPKNKLVVFSGLSGSGKSSLAFNTIYEEGRRRYIDSLSNYARTFLGGSSKPDVEAIDGLSPSIAIEQKTTHNNPRSTVATTTEIYDFLRLLFARIGIPFCPNHNIPIVQQTNKDIIDDIYKDNDSKKLIIYSPLISQQKGTHQLLLDSLKKEGFLRVKIDGEIYMLNDEINLEKNKKHDIDLVIDRTIISLENLDRISEGIRVALEHGKDNLKVEIDQVEKIYSKKHACIYKDFQVPLIEPRLFSFNSPYGMCKSCKGLGLQLRASWELLVPNKFATIRQGAIQYFKTINPASLEWQTFKALLDNNSISIDQPINNMTNAEIDIIKYGSEEDISYTLKSSSGNSFVKHGPIEGILTKVERLYFETNSTLKRKMYSRFMSDSACNTCKGKRLNQYALSVKINDKNIDDITKLSIEHLIEFIKKIQLNEKEMHVVNLVISEINNRLFFLNDVGLGYLTLNRKSLTLSGGEAQRIRLATQIGSGLSGVLYVLDEPSIGLHQKDNQKLLNSLKKMVDIGNTLIVVEHDEDTIRQADYIVDIGPYAGEEGGKVVAAGTLEDIMKNQESITGKYLSGELEISIPSFRRSGNGKVLKIIKASKNNLKNIDVKIPLGKFVGVAGVSGSGKSTLINQILVNGIKKKLNLKHEEIDGYSSIEGLENIDKIIDIDQSPIGRTPRSNPATYCGVFDDIRELFANTPQAKVKGFTKSQFSFNVPGGRCEKCDGEGSILIEMHFLPDVYVQCDECEGRRYNLETLEAKYHGKTISDVLNMSIDKAYDLFVSQTNIKNKLQTLKDVGLGYIKLGQSSTTLSGGEAQRVKLATYLLKNSTGKTIYVLDEPTTGLHPYDVNNLINVLNRIVDNGDSVIVIEHNLDVLKSCDYIIDLGPGGGVHGGKIVASGTPEQVAKNENSFTGQYLEMILNNKIT
ncbi:excinuclease ABC subunit UvrA [Mycoplasma sp. M5725]|uniref:UvrABC system protein A n=1 Tax=Mycoplasma phocimorsus TaxID=3045839 RepID=A0AAJ1PRZ9_9MOLU|nr:excinuclease ABC subunit UvrA [Mycoplasma phocimorsus]MDJ1645638.1 excinuclease ABC subunit UvrA [Mycoplasma phocimorsus]